MDDSDLFEIARFPTPSRPLQGVTVLVVEDSRYASDAMRLLCLRSGARIRRADSLTSAERHLSAYQPTVISVDLGLPDGDGLQLIEKLHRAKPRISVILGTCGDDAVADAVSTAGADGFLLKPVRSLASFQELVLSLLPEDYHPMGPRIVNDDVVCPDAVAYAEDLLLLLRLLTDDPSGKTLDYVAQFLSSVAHIAGDKSLLSAGEELAIVRMQHSSCCPPVARIAGLIQNRLSTGPGSKNRI
ncbi:KDP operon transcriptional regulatory protein KdpE [Thalassovita gelatinovora]|uniref:KDP operon transcriptional regulatory protein KdpE n=1 Tax=Thalassovita gelatinovora TaxID=53501 RepID=A0A0P1FD71_THAGE|nr:response regulator [Thalassovita gelatinovora]QIZ80601.1 response regulator [Thalassovita gelatinovora]CUH66144.1 KDP operon transcriptional regulatory protein KdpE [Thalassovita gelatinovora]SEQ77621.1 Response regulator receiver domain-containing protein [Thalassovita gelatinovora]